MVVDVLLTHRHVILQHWPAVQLSRDALHSKLSKELLVQAGLDWSCEMAGEDFRFAWK